MAVAQGYNKTSATDSLVFMYDTGDTTNCYLGKPTTNRFGTEITDPTLDSLAIGNGAGSNPQLGSGGTCSVALFNGEKVLAINRGTSSGVYYENRVYWTIPLTQGNYYSWSAWVYSTVPGPQLALEYFGGDYTWGVGQSYNIHTGTGWERLYAYASAPASSNTQTYCFIYLNTNNTIYVKDFQLENQIVPTQFTTGVRSSTQSLINLTNKVGINDESVSFTTTPFIPQITFDGTDDTIVVSGINLQQSFTLETVMKMYSRTSFGIFGQGITAQNQGLHILYNYGGRGMIYGMYANDNDYGANWIGELNTYYHIVFNYDSSTYNKEFYANGVLQTPAASAETVYSGTGDMRIGMAYGPSVGVSAPAYGDIPIVKIYNKVLTAAEVQNNYQNYKTRFNLS